MSLAPDPKVEIDEEYFYADGNVFALVGKASRALKSAGHRDAATEMSNRVMGGEAASYDGAIQIILEYVKVV